MGAVGEVICKNGDVFVVAFSLFYRRAFTYAKEYIENIRKCRKDATIVVAGDTRNRDRPQEVTSEEAKTFFDSLNPPVRYFEVSTKTGDNLMNMLQGGIREWYERKMDRSENTSYLIKCIVQ